MESGPPALPTIAASGFALIVGTSTGPSGGLHASIDEVLSAAPPDVDGSTLQAHFAPPRWRMPPPSTPCGVPHPPGTWNLEPARNMCMCMYASQHPSCCHLRRGTGTLEPWDLHNLTAPAVEPGTSEPEGEYGFTCNKKSAAYTAQKRDTRLSPIVSRSTERAM